MHNPERILRTLRRLGDGTLRYGRVLLLGLREDRLSDRAKSLTFATLLALVPLVVLSLVLFRAFGGLDEVEQQFYDLLGSYLLGGGGREAIGFLKEFSENFRAKTAGAVSVAVVLYSVITALSTIEGALGDIFKAPRRRPLIRRAPAYVTLVVLAPVLLSLSITLTGRFRALLDAQAAAYGVKHWLDAFGAWAMPLAIETLAILCLYVFMANVRVRLRAALTGAFVAALLFSATKSGFHAYLELFGASSYGKVYGSLAAVPILMIGLYLSWLVVLFGALFASTIQNFASLERLRADDPAKPNTAELIAVATAVARAFDEGRGAQGVEEVSELLGLPDRTVERALRD
ncbi:MAG: YihY/virulence factor BrkB family protein, partial [Candidatus Methylomirabilis sp.]|nr:YihY/virulence factor BrkB family protein [Deltaproteobacteria bacterium]